MGHPIHYGQRHTGHAGSNHMASRMFHIHSRTQDKGRMTHNEEPFYRNQTVTDSYPIHTNTLSHTPSTTHQPTPDPWCSLPPCTIHSPGDVLATLTDHYVGASPGPFPSPSSPHWVASGPSGTSPPRRCICRPSLLSVASWRTGHKEAGLVPDGSPDFPCISSRCSRRLLRYLRLAYSSCTSVTVNPAIFFAMWTRRSPSADHSGSSSRNKI